MCRLHLRRREKKEVLCGENELKSAHEWLKMDGVSDVWEDNLN